MKETYGFDPFSRILTQYKITDDGRKILTLYETSDDDKVQKSVEFIDKKEYDDLAKQLEYANKKIENRDQMIEELKEDRNYWRQQSEDLQRLREAAKKNDKTKELIERIRELEKTVYSYKGTIRGLEKTRDKLQARVNSLAKKLIKAEARVDAGKLKIETLLREK